MQDSKKDRKWEWEIWLTSRLWMHFAVVLMQRLLVQYWSSLADRRAKRMIVVKMGRKSAGKDRQEMLMLSVRICMHTIDKPHILQPDCNEHKLTHKVKCSGRWKRTSSAHNCLLMGSRLHRLPRTCSYTSREGKQINKAPGRTRGANIQYHKGGISLTDFCLFLCVVA